MSETKEIKLVKMCRGNPVHPGGPTTADVHPDEVENWKSGGWEVIKQAEKNVDKSKK